MNHESWPQMLTITYQSIQIAGGFLPPLGGLVARSIDSRPSGRSASMAQSWRLPRCLLAARTRWKGHRSIECCVVTGSTPEWVGHRSQHHHNLDSFHHHHRKLGKQPKQPTGLRGAAKGEKVIISKMEKKQSQDIP